MRITLYIFHPFKILEIFSKATKVIDRLKKREDFYQVVALDFGYQC